VSTVSKKSGESSSISLLSSGKRLYTGLLKNFEIWHLRYKMGISHEKEGGGGKGKGERGKGKGEKGKGKG
jgi:hypothetical protein